MMTVEETAAIRHNSNKYKNKNKNNATTNHPLGGGYGNSLSGSILLYDAGSIAYVLSAMFCDHDLEQTLRSACGCIG